MNYGLRESDIDDISQAIESFPEITQVIIFGSRAKGNYKPGSDVDAIKGIEVSYRTVSGLSFVLNEELSLPYNFDVVHYEKITEPQLIQHIDRVGKILFDKINCC